MQSVSIMGGQAVKLCFISTSPPAHRHPQKFSAGPSWNLWTSGRRDPRRFLDELRPYAPQLVAIAPDLEWVAQNELSIQLSISKIGSRNSL
jgi:hypothetical protein